MIKLLQEEQVFSIKMNREKIVRTHTEIEREKNRLDNWLTHCFTKLMKTPSKSIRLYDVHASAVAVEKLHRQLLNNSVILIILY